MDQNNITHFARIRDLIIFTQREQIVREYNNKKQIKLKCKEYNLVIENSEQSITPDHNTDLSALSDGWYRNLVCPVYVAFDLRSCRESIPLAERSCL